MPIIQQAAAFIMLAISCVYILMSFGEQIELAKFFQLRAIYFLLVAILIAIMS